VARLNSSGVQVPEVCGIAPSGSPGENEIVTLQAEDEGMHPRSLFQIRGGMQDTVNRAQEYSPPESKGIVPVGHSEATVQ
jgi:hypothetical protein